MTGKVGDVEYREGEVLEAHGPELDFIHDAQACGLFSEKSAIADSGDGGDFSEMVLQSLEAGEEVDLGSAVENHGEVPVSNPHGKCGNVLEEGEGDDGLGPGRGALFPGRTHEDLPVFPIEKDRAFFQLFEADGPEERRDGGGLHEGEIMQLSAEVLEAEFLPLEGMDGGPAQVGLDTVYGGGDSGHFLHGIRGKVFLVQEKVRTAGVEQEEAVAIVETGPDEQQSPAPGEGRGKGGGGFGGGRFPERHRIDRADAEFFIEADPHQKNAFGNGERRDGFGATGLAGQRENLEAGDAGRGPEHSGRQTRA